METAQAKHFLCSFLSGANYPDWTSLCRVKVITC